MMKMMNYPADKNVLVKWQAFIAFKVNLTWRISAAGAKKGNNRLLCDLEVYHPLTSSCLS